MLSLVIALAFFVALWAIFIVVLRRASGRPRIGVGKALLALFVITVVNLGVAQAVSPLLANAVPLWMAFIGIMLLQVLVGWMVLKLLLRRSWGRALAACLLLFATSAVAVALFLFVISPYTVATYIMPTHSMAPTLLGYHRVGVCPHCGRTATAAVGEANELFQPGENPLGICDSCQRPGDVEKVTPPVYTGDRFVVNKLLAPRRWDLVVYRALDDATQLHVKRLIGLPGEEVAIRDGGVWIDGVKLTPPADIAKIAFTAEAGRHDPDRPPGESVPVHLKADEFFVLGDFALRSSDSRQWGPLPNNRVVGVVDLVYFPFARARVLR